METRKLAKSFRLTDLAEVRSANHLKYGVDLRKAVPFCDQLVQSLQKYIRGIHVSYVILPPTKYPEVEVGGIGCPVERLRTAKFLRILSPMFSYIAAWSFLGSPGGVSDWELYVDGFESKQTESWEDVTRRTTPKVFPH